MPGTPSRMNQTAREQILSTDLNRIGNLAGRELMDRASLRSVRADFYKPSTNAFDDFTAAGKTAQATPIAGLTRPPSFDGVAGVFDVDFGAGEAQLPATSSNPDLSAYELARWPAQRLTWPSAGNPDATNPKICLIVATPADVLADVQNRNILLNPDTREVSPEDVYKTSNPVATLSVVAGSALAAPLAPAVPAGALALFEVYVPALAADSTTFLPVRRAWRQIEFPGTSQHGIVKGCVPFLDNASALLALTGAVHRIVIDGELLTFSGTGTIVPVADTVTPPTAAPATNDRPLYLYLCGGRNQPCMDYTFAGAGGTPTPVRLVLSATAPDALGFPKAGLAIATPAITFPRAACCYVGVMFYAVGTTNGVPAAYDGDWIFAQRTISTGGVGTRAFFEPLQTGAITTTPFTLASQPASSDVCILSAAGGGGVSSIYDSLGNLLDLNIALSGNTPPVHLSFYSMAHLGSSVAGGATLRPSPVGYNMNIPRLAR